MWPKSQSIGECDPRSVHVATILPRTATIRYLPPPHTPLPVLVSPSLLSHPLLTQLQPLSPTSLATLDNYQVVLSVLNAPYSHEKKFFLDFIASWLQVKSDIKMTFYKVHTIFLHYSVQRVYFRTNRLLMGLVELQQSGCSLSCSDRVIWSGRNSSLSWPCLSLLATNITPRSAGCSRGSRGNNK